MWRFGAFLALSTPLFSAGALALPQLVVGGFSWAENLCFDGLGSLFVSDFVKGQLVRISLSADGTSYDRNVHLDGESGGFLHFGGLAATRDGATLFFASTLQDKSSAVFATTTSPAPPNGTAEFRMVGKTQFQGNGVALDEDRGILYYTYEGWKRKGKGYVNAMNLTTGDSWQVASHEYGFDGCWLDTENSLLYVSLLVSKHVAVYNVSSGNGNQGSLVGEFSGLGYLSDIGHLLDDLTLTRNGTDLSSLGNTVVLGADWLGKAVRRFRLDGHGGSEIVSPPPGLQLHQPTSVRWGKGPGFDPQSIYVSEGGGVLPSQTSRRVVQFSPE